MLNHARFERQTETPPISLTTLAPRFIEIITFVISYSDLAKQSYITGSKTQLDHRRTHV